MENFCGVILMMSFQWRNNLTL